MLLELDVKNGGLCILLHLLVEKVLWPVPPACSQSCLRRSDGERCENGKSKYTRKRDFFLKAFTPGLYMKRIFDEVRR